MLNLKDLKLYILKALDFKPESFLINVGSMLDQLTGEKIELTKSMSVWQNDEMLGQLFDLLKST